MTNSKPLMVIGWLLVAEENNTYRLRAYRQAAHTLCAHLQEQFPQFHWEMPFIIELRFPPYGALSPLPLLEMGVHEKISRRWDFALVLAPNELIPRQRIFTLGVPSSALETAVLSTARLRRETEPMLADDPEAIDEARLIDGLNALALHLLGHVWGLEHTNSGPMAPPEECEGLCPTQFPANQQQAVVDRLEEVTDARLEEQPRRWRRLPFYWRTFWADPEGIWTDVIGYKPWRLPFRMGRLTAAAAVSIVFLLLGAESWEVGTNQSLFNLIAGAAVAIGGATLFLFWGQNLGEVARSNSWREQIIRTRIVVFFTLLLGMAALWGVLFLASLLAAAYVPARVPAGWLGLGARTGNLGLGLLSYQAALMATLGVFGGALGGNLEDEDAIKTQLFYDEEM